MASYKSKCTANFIRVLEPCIILSIMTTIHVYLPRYMGCTPVDCIYVNKQNATPGRIYPYCKDISALEVYIFCSIYYSLL